MSAPRLLLMNREVPHIIVAFAFHVQWDAAEPDALIATFQLSDTVEFKRWVKGFGERAEVIKPDWLRKEMHDELIAAAGVYET